MPMSEGPSWRTSGHLAREWGRERHRPQGPALRVWAVSEAPGLAADPEGFAVSSEERAPAEGLRGAETSPA